MEHIKESAFFESLHIHTHGHHIITADALHQPTGTGGTPLSSQSTGFKTAYGQGRGDGTQPSGIH